MMKKPFFKLSVHTAFGGAIALMLSGAAVISQAQPGAAPSETVAIKGPRLDASESGGTVAQVGRAVQNVFRLYVDADGLSKGGTAFLVNGQRIVATNNHVVEGGTSFRLGVKEPGGRTRRIALRLLATYPQKDLALLEAGEDLPGAPLPLATQSPPPGSDLFAIGFPAAADSQGGPPWSNSDDESHYIPSVVKGIVSRVLPNRWLTSQLQHQTPIQPGYSGGPLITPDGTVAGVSTSIHREAAGISYGVLAADLAELTAACSVPGATDQIAVQQSPGRETRSVSDNQNRINTHAIQQQRPLSREDFASLNRAELMLRDGSIYGVRLLCQHLVNNTGASEAYHCLARAFDPDILSGLNVRGITGDAQIAQFYYAESARVRRQAAVTDLDDTMPLMQPSAAAAERACDASLCKLVSRAGSPVISCERKHRN